MDGEERKQQMSNAKIVENIYNSFLSRDIAAVMNSISDDCDWNAIGAPLVPYGGKFHGKEAIGFFQKIAETISIENFTPNRIEEIKNGEVIAFGNMQAKANNTGKSFTTPWFMHWKLNNGKVVYFHNYFDTAAAVSSIS